MSVDFDTAKKAISEWREEKRPARVGILIDQPIIVKNDSGQRHVENLISSPIGRRRGGVLSSNKTRYPEAFGEEAPVRLFIKEPGKSIDPTEQFKGTDFIYETYPVLTMVALNWLIPVDQGRCRLPKYNPQRRTFSKCDWKYVCRKLAEQVGKRGLENLKGFIEKLEDKSKPEKADQDSLDACFCLLVGMYLVEFSECFMIGDLDSGYVLVPHSECLQNELEARCQVTGREASAFLRKLP